MKLKLNTIVSIDPIVNRSWTYIENLCSDMAHSPQDFSFLGNAGARRHRHSQILWNFRPPKAVPVMRYNSYRKISFRRARLLAWYGASVGGRGDSGRVYKSTVEWRMHLAF